MGKFIINGGVPLYGRVRVSGSKNSALPILFATLAVHGVSRIRSLPNIGDVRIALEVLAAFGARITRVGEVTEIDTRTLDYVSPPAEKLACLRASTYLIGAGLIRFGRVELPEIGGCNFSARPIDMHLDTVRAFGGSVDGTSLELPSPHGAGICFLKRSVGATVNALILASGIPDESVIEGAACEPHIMNLVAFLRSAGARIEYECGTFRVRGCKLGDAEVTVGGDMIEAGTYLAAALVTGGRVKVSGVDTLELSSFIRLISESGAECRTEPDGITVSGRLARPCHVVTGAYPDFPTDLQPIIAPALAHSGGKITDTVWCDRFGYLDELRRLGVSSRRLGNTAEIFPSEYKCATATAPDLRGGMALLLAALGADGVSVIDSAHTVLRGYEEPEVKLRALGAEIEYVQ